MKCPKCDGEMEKGKRASWGALWETPSKGGLFQWVIKNSRINGYSCLKCGFIEEYVERK